jgi:hypothetical protein
MAEGFTFGGGPLSEGKYLGDWLKWEQDAYYSRSTSAMGLGVAVDTVYPSGALLETDAASGVKLFDGTGTLLGILRNPVVVRAGESVPVSMIVRDAVIDIRGIPYALSGITEAAAITRITTDLPRIIIAQKG